MRVFLAVVVMVGVLLRCYNLNNRPLHNDEGVNYHFLKEIESRGYYPYSHENYHGPLYFYLTNIFYNHRNESVRDIYELRASAVVVGTILVMVPVLLLGGWQGVAGSALLSTSAGLVFYSRYAIHEMLFALVGSVFGLGLFCYLRSGKVSFGYLAAAALALMIGTKETFIITLASITIAALITFGPKSFFTRLWVDRGHLFWGAVLLWSLIVIQFTGALRWPTGLNEMILAVPQWVSRNTSDYGHFKPIDYYLNVYSTTEPTILVALLACIAVVAGLFRKQQRATSDPLAIFCAVWTLTIFLIYSGVKYKTPWLIINITTPALITAAVFLSGRPARYRQLGLAALLFIGSIYMARFVFVVPYGPGNPFSYTHTSSGMVEVSEKIVEYRKSNPNAMVLIAAAQYWPLPFYLRGHESFVHYVNSKDLKAYLERYDIIVMDKSVVEDVPGFARYYSRISDVQECQIYTKAS